MLNLIKILKEETEELMTQNPVIKERVIDEINLIIKDEMKNNEARKKSNNKDLWKNLDEFDEF